MEWPGEEAEQGQSLMSPCLPASAFGLWINRAGDEVQMGVGVGVGWQTGAGLGCGEQSHSQEEGEWRGPGSSLRAPEFQLVFS